MREQHPSPLTGECAPPPGTEWMATLGSDGIGLTMCDGARVITAVAQPVDNWSNVACPDLVDMLRILALELKRRYGLANDLRRVGIDVTLETQTGGHYDRFSESPRQPDARYR